MGRWHETCVLTDLPIKRDEPVVMMMAEKEICYDERFFFEQLWELRAGTYNSYGWINEGPESTHPDYQLHTFFIKRRCWDRVLKIPLDYRESDPAKRVEDLRQDIRFWKILDAKRENPELDLHNWQPATTLPWEADLTLLDQFCHVVLFASQVRRTFGPRVEGKHQNLDLKSHEQLHNIRAIELRRMGRRKVPQ